jgi:hypothetical protein
MKSIVTLVVLGLFTGLVACSSDSGGSGSGSNGSSSTSSTCTKDYSCENGSCKCTNDGPNKGSSCCNPSDDSCGSSSTNCDSYCKVCK